MSAGGSAADRASSLVRETGTALIGWALAGWIITYNVIRILTGDPPADVVWISLPIGAIAGTALYLLVYRRIASELHRRRMARLTHATGTPSAKEGDVAGAPPRPEGLEQPQEDALRIAVWALMGFGGVALVMAALLLVDFLSAPSGDRPVTSIVLGIWNLVAALWTADEVARLRVFDLEGLDYGVFIPTFTAIMAALGLARDFVPVGQVVLIAVSAITGGLVGLAAWRLLPERGVPVLAPAAVIVCAVAFVLAVLG